MGRGFPAPEPGRKPLPEEDVQAARERAGGGVADDEGAQGLIRRCDFLGAGA
jgi:hypothetical protein